MRDVEKAALVRLSNTRDFKTVMEALERERKEALTRLQKSHDTVILYRAQGELKGLSWFTDRLKSLVK